MLPFTLLYCIEQVYFLSLNLNRNVILCTCILILKRNTRPRYLQIHTKYPYQHNQNLDLLQNFKTNSFLLEKELFLKKSLAWKIWILTMFIQKLFCHALFFHIIYRKDFLKMHSKPSEAYVRYTVYDIWSYLCGRESCIWHSYICSY